MDDKYRQRLKWLYGLERFGIKPGLSRINRFLKYLGNPQRTYSSILIAGTNGKGSVASALTSILTSAGYKVGFYTSPHILNFNERIRIGRQALIPDDFINKFIKDHKYTIEHNAYTFFETTTAMAFDYFALQNVDYAVIEVGMGGRLDATNILKPVLSVITSISYDHTERLGNTLELICKEKVGIIRNGKRLVLDDSSVEVNKSITELAERFGTRIDRISDLEAVLNKMDYDGIKFKVNDNVFSFPLIGKHQLNNALLAILAGKNLGCNDEIIRDGLSKTIWPGRFQVISQNPLIICDVGHNPDSAIKLRETLDYFELHPVNFIFAIMRDKDIQGYCRALFRPEDRVWVIPLENRRSEKPEKLFEMMSRGNHPTVKICGDCREALHSVFEDNLPIVITGSHYVLDACLRVLSSEYSIKIPGLPI